MENSKYKQQLQKWIHTQEKNISVQLSVIESQEKEIVLKHDYLQTLKSLNALDLEMLNDAKKELESL